MLSGRCVNKKIILLAQVFHGDVASHILTLTIGIITIRLLLKVLRLRSASVRVHEPNHLLIVLNIVVVAEELLLSSLEAELVMLLTWPT